MSFLLKGSQTQINKVAELAQTISQYATKFPYVESLPVDIPSIKGNRQTRAATLLKNLAKEGGFNPGVWRFPNVIKVSAEAGEQWIAQCIDKGYIVKGDSDHQCYMKGFINGSFYIRWDGDHRHKIWKGHYFPEDINNFVDAKEKHGSYDCMVYEVDNVPQANSLFVKIQKTLAKSLHPDDEWCNQYLSGDEETLKQADNMELCGVGVRDSNDDIFPKTTNGHWVRSRLFNEGVKRYGIANIKKAMIDCAKVLQSKAKWSGEIYDTFYNGMAVLYSVRPDAKRNGLNKNLVQFLIDNAKLNKRDFIELFKAKGGNQHNREAESFAYGVAKLFKNAVREGEYGGNNNMAGGLKVSTLFEDLDLKGDKDVA